MLFIHDCSVIIILDEVYTRISHHYQDCVIIDWRWAGGPLPLKFRGICMQALLVKIKCRILDRKQSFDRCAEAMYKNLLAGRIKGDNRYAIVIHGQHLT